MSEPDCSSCGVKDGHLHENWCHADARQQVEAWKGRVISPSGQLMADWRICLKCGQEWVTASVLSNLVCYECRAKQQVEAALAQFCDCGESAAGGAQHAQACRYNQPKQVEAFRERAAQLCEAQETGAGVDTGRIWRNTMRAQLAAAIRALTP